MTPSQAALFELGVPDALASPASSAWGPPSLMLPGQ
jgi:hypothetical protein